MNDGSMQKIVQALAERAQKEAHEQRKQEMIGVLAALYDKAVSYTNLILAAGYAGFFAVFAPMKESLSTVEALVSALSVSFSLSVFVFWEVGVMLVSAKDLGAVKKAIDSGADFERQIALARAAQERRVVSIRRIWFVVLLATIVPALIGAGTLMFSFVRQLIQNA